MLFLINKKKIGSKKRYKCVKKIDKARKLMFRIRIRKDPDQGGQK